MNYFENFVSATPSPNNAQSFFLTGDKDKEITSRVYAKLEAEGECTFSLLFSNILDTTFSDGSHSRKNRINAPYEIISARAGIVKTADVYMPTEPDNFVDVTFNGNKGKNVAAGEFFNTDEFTFNVNRGDFLCWEMTFKGTELVYHHENKMAVFVWDGDKFVHSVLTPLPGMVGVKKKATRLTFWGDSITQGCGTDVEGLYKFYASYIAEDYSLDVAVWDIGTGFARGDDAASNGAWMYKAKHSDIVSVCFGVNDIQQGFTYEQICKNLGYIIDELHKYGIKVIIQSIPPFELGDGLQLWYKVNDYIRDVLSQKADAYFDNVPILAPDDGFTPKYGSHPNALGHRLWADALGKFITEKFGIR